MLTLILTALITLTAIDAKHTFKRDTQYDHEFKQIDLTEKLEACQEWAGLKAQCTSDTHCILKTTYCMLRQHGVRGSVRYGELEDFILDFGGDNVYICDAMGQCVLRQLWF